MLEAGCRLVGKARHQIRIVSIISVASVGGTADVEVHKAHPPAPRLSQRVSYLKGKRVDHRVYWLKEN
jgi:hypothetical protein